MRGTSSVPYRAATTIVITTMGAAIVKKTV